MSKNIEKLKRPGIWIIRKLRFKHEYIEDRPGEQNELIDKIIVKGIERYAEKIKKNGLKNEILNKMPNLDLDKSIISKVKDLLSNARDIELGSGIGRLNIQYRNNAILITPSGTIGWILGQTVITDDQIMATVNDIIDQFQAKYIDDPSYIISKLRNIIENLSQEGIYKPSTSEEKSLYDLLMLMLLVYYTGENDVPEWIETAISNLEQVNVIENLIELIIDHIYSVVGNITQNLYFNFKLVLDSWILRLALNKKTNYGQISGLLDMFHIDVKSIVDSFANEYMSPSFVTGMGQLTSEMVSSFLRDNAENSDDMQEEDTGLPYQITQTLGTDPYSQRAFRWYTSENVKSGCIQYSRNKDLSDAKTVEATCERIIKPVTMINFGLVTTYETRYVSKYSAVLPNLDEDTTYWYRVGNPEQNLWSELSHFKIPHIDDSFMFINLADSQGMVKDDYEVFTKTFKAVVDKFPNASFVSHLGDFVDDGNNEDYWSWLLDSGVWRGKPIVPVAGNHEARVSYTLNKAGVENSILGHFNVQNIPKQDTSRGVYYSYVYKNATFIVLNTNDTNRNKELSEEQYDWAVETARTATTKWKIVLMHKSPYSNGPHHDDGDVRRISIQINRFVKDCEIDLVIAGHDHVYVRTPILSNMSRVSCKTKLIKHNGIKYETVVNPFGTLFVIPGTSGVKNYKQDLSVILPNEVVAQPDCPIYSVVSIDAKRIYFTAYKFDIETGTSTLLDSYAIEKSEEKLPDFEIVSNMISSLPKDISDLDSSLINEALYLYNKLSTKDKKKVKNYAKLMSSKQVLTAYEDINSKCSVVVGTKEQFINALNNKNIGTIITDGTNIKFETFLGKKNRYEITRNLCIKGNSILSNVCFGVKNSSTLILDDCIKIDCTRKQGSVRIALNTVELDENCTIILNDKASLRTEYGIGSGGYCIYSHGRNSSMYLNSSSEQWASKCAIYAPHRNTRVVINSGKYTNKHSRYAVSVNGMTVVNGGRLKSLKTQKDSELYINEGAIGCKSIEYVNAPLNISGNAYITGLKIRKCNTDMIKLSGSKTNLYIQSDHRGSVDIGGITPYISRAETTDYSEIRFRVPNDGNSAIYTRNKPVPSFSDLTRALVKEIRPKDEYYMTADLPQGNNYVFIKMLYAGKSKTKTGINCDKGAKAYIYSKIRNIQNNPIEKIGFLQQSIKMPLYNDLGKNTKFRVYYNSYPQNAFNDAVQWSTSDEKIISVDQFGRVEAHSRGTAMVTIRLLNNKDVQDSCMITIE